MRSLQYFKWFMPLAILAITILSTYPVFADSPSVDNVKVFQNYRENGDWLVVCTYNNTELPYYNLSDPRDSWQIQLVNPSNVVVTSFALQTWGMRPGCNYLSAFLANSQVWGNTNYSIRIQATYNTSINASRYINASDWVGSDLTKLDSWCIFQARTMTVYDGIVYTYDTTKYETVLNSLGGIYFAKGIYELQNVRPDIFLVLVGNLSSDPWSKTFNHTYENYLYSSWGAAIGPELTAALNMNGTVLGISGNSLGGIIIFLSFIALATLAVAMGHFAAGISLAFVVLLAGAVIGLIPLSIIILAGAMFLFFFVLKIVISGT